VAGESRGEHESDSMKTPTPLVPLLLLALLLVLAAAFPSAATAIELPDLREIQAETRKLQAFTGEVEEIVERSLARVWVLEHRLADQEINLEGSRIDAGMLRAARLDLDSMQSRVAVMKGRIEQRELALARIAAQIAALKSDLAVSDRWDTELLRKEAGLALLRDQPEATASNAQALERLIGAARRNA
jgi:hypothetical protein